MGRTRNAEVRSTRARRRVISVGSALLFATAGLAGITITSAPAAYAAVSSGGEIVMFGENSQGQIGDGTAPGTQWKAIDAGRDHTLALRNDGTVWAWGDNFYGQLGNNTLIDSSMPVQVTGPGGAGFLTGITSISAGNGYSLARRSDGSVWAWGWNSYGQLGNNTLTNSSTPVQVTGPGGAGFLTGITQVSAGTGHSLARRSDGTVWAWGRNSYGQLGNNTLTDSSTPVQVVGFFGFGFLTGITQVSAGTGYSLARRSDGTVWAWGRNFYGQLGNNTLTDSRTPVQVVVGVGFLTGITQVSAGDGHSLARRSDGSVWAWGWNFAGQLGNNTLTISSTPVQVTGPGGAGFLTGITSISAGARHSLARRRDGTVWAWGSGGGGKLGVGFADSTAPVQAASITRATSISGGGEHSVVLRAASLVATPGTIAYGTLRTDTTATTGPITITNIDTIPVTVNAIATTGTDAAAFDPNASALPTTLAPGASLTISTLTATTDATARTYSAALLVDTDQPEPLTIPITLRAVVSTWTLGPATLSFPTTAVGVESATQDVTMANTGLVPVSTVATTLSGLTRSAFRIAGSTCPPTLAPGANCVLHISQLAATAGALSATLNVATDAGTKTVALTGAALNPADVNVWLSGPTTATAATPIATTVNVTNLGPAAAKGIQITLDIGTGGTFSSVSAAGYTCTTISATQRSCTRSFIANGASANLTVNASWTAGPRSITATLTTGTIDPDPTDNTATRNITVA